MSFLMCSQEAPKLQVIKNHIWSRECVLRPRRWQVVGTWQASVEDL